DCAGAGNNRGPRCTADLPDRRHPDGRLCADLPATRLDQLASEHCPGAGRARAGGLQSGPLADAGAMGGHDPACRARRRGQRCPGGLGHRQRAAGDTDAGTERHANARHGVLVFQRRARLCGCCALCLDHGAVLAAAHVVAVHAFETGGGAMNLLELQGIRPRYGEVTALDHLNLSVPAGSRAAVVGPSGSGKTTLLRIIAGFDAPDAGKVVLDGQVLTEGAKAVPAHRRGIGYVAQDGALFPHLSIADNIGFGLSRRDPARDTRIAALIQMVELDPAMLRRRPDELSGGQQQRVALARALAREPRLMLLDEPFSALDTRLRASARKAVARVLSAARMTTILVTHDQSEALSFADQIAVLREGRLLQVGTPRELYLRPKDAMIAEFMGDAIVLPARV